MTDRDQPTAGVALKPCPFDHSSAFVGSTLDDQHYVMCSVDGCGGMVGYFETPAEAITAWNRRATPASGAVEAAEIVLRWANWIIDESADMEAAFFGPLFQQSPQAAVEFASAVVARACQDPEQ